MASSTWGSCSHFFNASTLLVFRWGLASMKTASAHKIPEFEHSCKARAIKLLAMFLMLAFHSSRIEANLKGQMC